MSFFLAAIGKPYIPGREDLRPFMPELWLIATLVGLLLAPFFTRRANLWSAVVALAGVTLALVSVAVVGFAAPAEHFRGLLVSDPVAGFWKAILLLFVIGVILLWVAVVSPTMHQGDGPEFFTLLIGATLGMSLMASTSNLLMLVLSVELASLPSYVLAGFRKTHRVGAEASLKYVLFGAVTSSIMIYGVSMLYGLTGSLSFGEIFRSAAEGQIAGPVFAIGLIALLIGIGFKISAVPFHLWCPDVFEGAGIDVAAFLSVASKGAGLILLLRLQILLSNAFQFHIGMIPLACAVVIGILGALTMTVGNTAAFVQSNIKRLLAYSSIAQAGYMLSALSITYGAPGASMQVILIYLSVYLFMNLGAFTVAGVVARHAGSEEITAFRGLGTRSPFLAVCMAVFLFSLVGLPPFAGFIAKLVLLKALASSGGGWWWLVAVVGINTVMSLYYYMRIVRAMYLEPAPKGSGHLFPNPLALGVSMGCAAMLFALFIGFWPLNRGVAAASKVAGIDTKHLSRSLSEDDALMAGR